MLGVVVGLPHLGGDFLGERADWTGDVTQDGAGHVVLHSPEIAVAGGPDSNPGRAAFPPSLPLTILHDIDSGPNKLGGYAVHQDNAVRNPPAQLEHVWTGRGDIDRDASFRKRQPSAALGPERHGLASQEVAALRDRRFE